MPPETAAALSPFSVVSQIWRAVAAAYHQPLRFLSTPRGGEAWGERHTQTVGDVGAERGEMTVGILMLKWFDMFGIIAGSVVGGGRSGASQRLIGMSPMPISWSGRSERCTCHPCPHIVGAPRKGQTRNCRTRTEDEGSKTCVCTSVDDGGRVAESWPPNVKSWLHSNRPTRVC